MARVKFGAVVTDMRGKLGGHIFQASGSTRVLRTGRKPRVVKSRFTAVQESYLKRAHNNWNTNTSDAKKLNWFYVAPNYPVKNAFGDKIAISAKALYLKRYMATQQAGFSGPPDPTDTESYIPPATTWNASVNTTAGTLTMGVGNIIFEYGYALWVWKARNTFQKVNFNKFNLFYNTKSTFVGSAVAYNALVDAVGSISPSDVIYVAVVATRINGFKNAPVIKQAIIS